MPGDFFFLKCATRTVARFGNVLLLALPRTVKKILTVHFFINNCKKVLLILQNCSIITA